MVQIMIGIRTMLFYVMNCVHISVGIAQRNVWACGQKPRGGELVLSNKTNTLKFFQNLSIESIINFFKHNNRWNKEIEKKIEHKYLYWFRSKDPTSSCQSLKNKIN